MNRNQGKNRNRKISKAEVRLENERFDGALRDLAWQYTVEGEFTEIIVKV
jgi:hypothetical protein